MASEFSSSNPFRRKTPAPFTSSTTHIAYQQADTPPVVGAPKKITKKVRVQSPPPPSPSVPDSASTIGDESFSYMPTKPPTPVRRDEDPFDNTTSDTSEDEAISGPGKAPANPFSKTLETMERAGGEGPAVPPTNISSPGRASLDVEAFKRLLMTGNAGLGISTTGPPTQGQVAHHALGGGDGGSSTDASSISRQSIFEAIQETHPESPRTSHEISEPDDDRRGLTSEHQSSISARKKPPPPSSRHGKLIRVELRDEPTVNIVQSPSTPGSFTSQTYFSSSPVHSNRSQTDLNKPLPPAPRRASHDSDRESVFDKESAGKTPEPPSPSSSIRRKTPPAPPVARRHSQLVSDSKISQSNSGRLSPRVEEDNISIAATESGRPRSDSGKAPPPPPTRRPTSTRGSSSHHLPLLSPPLVPTPPPTRGTSRHGRPPSVISLEVNKRASVVPPPPPPHRHGKENEKLPEPSGEHSRRSTDSVQRDSVSVSQLTKVETNPGNHDILADLSALQRDIDALRTNSQSGGERVT